MKYIRHDRICFVLWQSIGGRPAHSEVAAMILKDQGGAIVSAGFVMYSDATGPHCFGDSGSLQLSSQPGDTDALKAQLASI